MKVDWKAIERSHVSRARAANLVYIKLFVEEVNTALAIFNYL